MNRIAKTIGVSLATALIVGDGSVVIAGGTIAAGVTNGIEIYSAATGESVAVGASSFRFEC